MRFTTPTATIYTDDEIRWRLRMVGVEEKLQRSFERARAVRYVSEAVGHLSEHRSSGPQYRTAHCTRVLLEGVLASDTPQARALERSLLQNTGYADTLMQQVWNHAKVQRFWQERDHYGRPESLTITEKRDLERAVRHALPTQWQGVSIVQEISGR